MKRLKYRAFTSSIIESVQNGFNLNKGYWKIYYSSWIRWILCIIYQIIYLTFNLSIFFYEDHMLFCKALISFKIKNLCYVLIHCYLINDSVYYIIQRLGIFLLLFTLLISNQRSEKLLKTNYKDFIFYHYILCFRS